MARVVSDSVSVCKDPKPNLFILRELANKIRGVVSNATSARRKRANHQDVHSISIRGVDPDITIVVDMYHTDRT